MYNFNKFQILMLIIFIYYLNIYIQTDIFSFNDAPYPWQIGFQDPASPGFSGIFNLHNEITFFLFFILFSVV